MFGWIELFYRLIIVCLLCAWHVVFIQDTHTSMQFKPNRQNATQNLINLYSEVRLLYNFPLPTKPNQTYFSTIIWVFFMGTTKLFNSKIDMKNDEPDWEHGRLCKVEITKQNTKKNRFISLHHFIHKIHFHSQMKRENNCEKKTVLEYIIWMDSVFRRFDCGRWMAYSVIMWVLQHLIHTQKFVTRIKRPLCVCVCVYLYT